MKKHLLLLTAILCLAGQAFAATGTRIYATLSVTNLPALSNSWVLNGDERWFVTGVGGTNSVQITNTVPQQATNIFVHLISYPYTNNVELYYAASNAMTLVGAINAAMSLSVTGTWATVTYTTNQVYSSASVWMPYPTNYSDAFKSNQMTHLSSNLSLHAGFPVATNAPMLANYSLKVGGTNTSNYFIGPTITGGTMTSTVITNASLAGSFAEILGTAPNILMTHTTPSTPAALAPILGMRRARVSGSDMTNAASGDQLGTFTLQGRGLTEWKSGARIYAYALEDFSDTASSARLSFDLVDTATDDLFERVRFTYALASFSNSVYVAATATISNIIASNAWLMAASITNATGAFSAATVTNLQAHGGTVRDSIITNATLYAASGLLTNVRSHSLSATNSTLSGTNYVANIARVGVQAIESLAAGVNTLPAITAPLAEIITNPAAPFSVDGIPAGASGQWLVLINLSGQNMTIKNQSGSEPTPANRITTMTGADQATTGNGTATLYYSASEGAWILVALDP